MESQNRAAFVFAGEATRVHEIFQVCVLAYAHFLVKTMLTNMETENLKSTELIYRPQDQK